MARLIDLVHHAYMAKGKPHYLREWRKSKDLSLEAVAERVTLLSQEKASADPESQVYSTTYATLGRIERGKLPYNQHLLELLAEIYGTDEASLLIRDPTRPDAPWTIMEGLTPAQQAQAIAVIEAIKRTGTEG